MAWTSRPRETVGRILKEPFIALLAAAETRATGFATCDSGPRDGWQSQATFEKELNFAPAYNRCDK